MLFRGSERSPEFPPRPGGGERCTTRLIPLITAILTLAAVVCAAPLAAEPRPSSDLLLPYFEVDLGSASGKTTLFAVGNAGEDPVTVQAAVATNWGIRLFQSTIELEGGEVRTVNLRDWLTKGQLPDRTLDPDALAHVQAALSGQVSPKDQMYYGTQPDPFKTDLAVGYVTLRVTTSQRPDVLWGDYFFVTPGEDFAEGDLLVNIDPTMPCAGLCDVHRLRFLDGGVFDGGTKLIIWSPRVGQPSPDANALSVGTVLSVNAFHKESGAEFDQRDLDLLPVQQLDVRDLLLAEPFGWLDLATDEKVYVGVRYTAGHRFSIAMQSWCLPEDSCPECVPNKPKTPAIDIEKSTNGEDADEPIGPTVLAGDPVTWEYMVTNTGNVVLNQIQVTDDQEGPVDCPKSTLQPDESMTCTKSGAAPVDVPAAGFFYENLAEVTGTPPSGPAVHDSDPSHYFTPGQPDKPIFIDIEKATNGVDADTEAEGPTVEVDSTVTWSYVVTNTNPDITLENIAVVDDKEGAVTCPKTTLAPGESMTCSPKTGVAIEGQYANLATVTGRERRDRGSGHRQRPEPLQRHQDSAAADAPGRHREGDQRPRRGLGSGTPAHRGRPGDLELRGDQHRPGGAVERCGGGRPGGRGELPEDVARDRRVDDLHALRHRGRGPVRQPGDRHRPGSAGRSGDRQRPEPLPRRPPDVPGDQGCTPGYWKNHTDSWPPTGFSPAQSVQSVFAQAAAYPAYGTPSLLQALSFQGGSGVEGGVGNLLRAAVAALLNSSHSGVDYPATTASVISSVDAALASGDRATMLTLASSLDSQNNLGCPLN